jgi:hypothetical protein
MSKLKKSLGLAMLGLILSIAPVGFGQANSHSVVLKREAKVGDVVLAPGRYDISFDETKSGELVVLKGGHEIAKASYKLLDLPKGAQDSAVVFSATSDGSLVLRRIELKGKKVAIQFE